MARRRFFWDLCTRPDRRRQRIAKAIRRLLIPLIVAMILDAVVQYLLFHHMRIVGAIVTGGVLMGVPYSLAREIANRIACMRIHSPFQPRASRG